jgi:hypothetical protein
MMQRCGGKQGCTNQIGMKKGEKAGSLALLNISKRFTDIRGRKRNISGREISNTGSISPKGYHFLIIPEFGKIFA